MQTFNLTRLNFHAPYAVWMENNDYKFKTDYDVSYRIVFSPNQDIWKNGAYEFSIFNESSKPYTTVSQIASSLSLASVILSRRRFSQIREFTTMPFSLFSPTSMHPWVSSG